jgi:hypothetical protein
MFCRNLAQKISWDQRFSEMQSSVFVVKFLQFESAKTNIFDILGDILK